MLFIIHLPQQATGSSFVGFQGDPWISTHIDDLRPADGALPTLDEVLGATISELFLRQPIEHTETWEYLEVLRNNEGKGEEIMSTQGNGYEEEEAMVIEGQAEQVLPKVPSPKVVPAGRGQYYHRLHGCIHAAASKLQDSEKSMKRATERVEILMELIPKEPFFPLGEFCVRYIKCS